MSLQFRIPGEEKHTPNSLAGVNGDQIIPHGVKTLSNKIWLVSQPRRGR